MAIWKKIPEGGGGGGGGGGAAAPQPPASYAYDWKRNTKPTMFLVSVRANSTQENNIFTDNKLQWSLHDLKYVISGLK